MKNKLRSVLSVIAGFLAVAILSTLTDFILENTGIFPSYAIQMANGSPVWVLVTALIYRSVYAFLGGFITAKLSPSNPMKHVMVLAIIGTLGGVAGVINGWAYGNQWYPIDLAVTAYPLVWYGGELGKKR